MRLSLFLNTSTYLLLDATTSSFTSCPSCSLPKYFHFEAHTVHPGVLNGTIVDILSSSSYPGTILPKLALFVFNSILPFSSFEMYFIDLRQSGRNKGKNKVLPFPSSLVMSVTARAEPGMEKSIWVSHVDYMAII